MRAKEFLSERPIEEGDASGSTQFNSELGCMLGFVGADATLENLLNPKFKKYNTKLIKPNDVRAQAQLGYDQGLYIPENFNAWVKLGAAIKSKTKYKGKVGWDGTGQGNQGGVADVVFEDGATHSGISIKETSGITLTNTSPKELGFDYTGDIFKSYFEKYWLEWKQAVVDRVLELAQSGRVIGAPKTDSEGNPVKQSGGGEKLRAIQYNHDDHTDDAGNVYKADTYTIWYGKGPDIKTWKREAFTKDAINKAIKAGNSLMQRVFGDWYQTAIAGAEPKAIEYQEKLFKAFTDKALEEMSKALAKPKALSKLLQMSESKPYYYYMPESKTKGGKIKPEKLYEVPGTGGSTGINVNLKLAGPIEYKQVKGTGQKYHVKVWNVANGTPDPDAFAIVTLYIRYANGLFAENPTARVQELKGAEHLLWQPIE